MDKSTPSEELSRSGMNSVRNVACCVCGSVQHLGGADGAGKMWKLPGVVYGKARGVYRGVRGGGVAIGGGGGGGGGGGRYK